MSERDDVAQAIREAILPPGWVHEGDAEVRQRAALATLVDICWVLGNKWVRAAAIEYGQALLGDALPHVGPGYRGCVEFVDTHWGPDE